MDSSATGGARDDVEQACASIRRHLDQGAPWDACDAFREAALRHPDDPSLLHLGALAHARAGATGPAHALLERAQPLASSSPGLLVEILSLRGRLWKDEARRAKDPARARLAIGRALEGYLAAHALRDDAYPAVNAATLSWLAGDSRRARELAQRALDRVDGLREPSRWDHATAGEAALLLGRVDLARSRYAMALAAAPGDTGAIASMRRQLALLARALPQAVDMLAILRAPDVVAFAGHRIDAPDAATARFPAPLVPAVDAELRARVARMNSPILYASAACGADLLLVTAALDAGAEVNLVLPFDRDDFVRASVATGGPEWVRRFDDAIGRVAHVTYATEGRHVGDDVAFEHAAQLVEGLAVLRAAQLETKASMLCVLDPEAPGATGGTRQSFERWRVSHGEPEILDLGALRAADGGQVRAPAPRAMPAGPPAGVNGPARRTLRTMLFADIVGYSRIPDATVPAFQARFWSIAARELDALPSRPPLANTWGDAIYVVFDEPRDGADFASRLSAAMAAEDWSGLGIEDACPIRVALHAGPVYRGHDPVLGRDNFYGASVTRTARIEPVTPPGSIYASEAYAATLAALGQGDCALEYVGRIRLAKNYGETRIYRLERPADAERPDPPDAGRRMPASTPRRDR